MAEPALPPTGTSTDAFLYGVRRAATSVFAFVIIFTYIGFGALCHDYGFSVGWAMLSTALQWAGPAQVVLVTGLGARHVADRDRGGGRRCRACGSCRSSLRSFRW